MAGTWKEFVHALEQQLSVYEAIMLKNEPSGRAASLDVYLDKLKSVSPDKPYGAGPLAHLDEFLSTYIKRVEKLRDDPELSGMDSSAMGAYFLLSKRLSAKSHGLPFEFLEKRAPINPNDLPIQKLIKRYPELLPVLTGRPAAPVNRSAPAPENVVDNPAASARRSSPLLSQLVPSRVEKLAPGEQSRRRPNLPKRVA